MENLTTTPPDTKHSVMSARNDDPLIRVTGTVDAIHVVHSATVSRLHAAVIAVVLSYQRVAGAVLLYCFRVLFRVWRPAVLRLLFFCAEIVDICCAL